MAHAAPPRHPWSGDEHADSEMTGYILMVGLMVVFAGIVYVLATNIANGDATVQNHAAVAQLDTGSGDIQFVLVKAGAHDNYNVDLSAPTGVNDARINLDGRECSYADGHFQIDGPDVFWDVGEKLTFLQQCDGVGLSGFKSYSITIAVDELVVYQDDGVRPM